MINTANYQRDGYALLPGLLSADEVTFLREYAHKLLSHDDSVMHKGDKEGKTTLLKMWNIAGDNPFSLIARDQRLVDLACQALVDKDVYIYSHKMTMKEPFEGGAWEWHQDYGYWYEYGCLDPRMLSIWIALDDANKANGCLQILEGSHKLGRINHIREDGQSNCDPERVEEAKKRCLHKYIEINAGDAIIFDCNLLHKSDANTSPKPRWGFISSYNRIVNEPYKMERDYGHDINLQPVPASEALRRKEASS